MLILFEYLIPLALNDFSNWNWFQPIIQAVDIIQITWSINLKINFWPKLFSDGKREDVYMTPDDFVRSLTPSGELQPVDCLLDQFRKIRTSQVSIHFTVEIEFFRILRCIKGNRSASYFRSDIFVSTYILFVVNNDRISQTKIFNKSSGGRISIW